MLTLFNSIFLWVFGVHVYILLMYTISISILYVSYKEFSLLNVTSVSNFWKTNTLWNSENKFFDITKLSFIVLHTAELST